LSVLLRTWGLLVEPGSLRRCCADVKRVGRLPVVEREQVIGIITIGDLVKSMIDRGPAAQRMTFPLLGGPFQTPNGSSNLPGCRFFRRHQQA
jgi:hypothetical protein